MTSIWKLSKQSASARLFGLARISVLALGALLAGFAPAASAAEPCPQEALREAQGSTPLPDCRGWELVSPPNKHGGGIEPIGFSSTQAAANGAAITYDANGSIVPNPLGNLLGEAQALSTRGPGGWSTQDITTPHDEVATVGFTREYRLFSSDLSLGLAEPSGETPLAPGVSGEALYLRENATDEFQAIADSTELGAEHLTFDGATPDLRHLVFAAEDNLYESSGGQAQLIGSCANLGDAKVMVRNAISSDGSRLIWPRTTGSGTGCSGDNELRLSDTASGESIRLDALQGGSGTGKPNPRFQTASGDGSKVFFTDEQALTKDSTATSKAPDLYEFELTSGAGEPLAGELTDLTVPLNPVEHSHVRGLAIGASEDGSSLYLVAAGVLAANQNAEHETATPGGQNLYLAHEDGSGWKTEFIAGLSAADGHDWSGEGGFVEEGGPLESDLGKVTSRVSPNGRFLAFMSARSLTDYDNRDASSGEADEEVYLYDSQTQHLICASCNPSGERPHGVYASNTAREGTTLLVDRPDIWTDRWLAASIPGWSAINIFDALYQSRYLSDSGRLFFDSTDALVPRDTNGTEDVYQYEPEGVGSCAASSAGFDPTNGGCISLISGGTSNEESVFLDASESGDDVFFLSSSRLAPQDSDNALDVYDAHVCGAAGVPCTAAPTPAPPCTSPDACHPAPPPPPSEQGTASSSPRGGEQAPPPPRCKPGFIRRHGRCVKKKNHGHKTRKRAAGRKRGGAPR